LTMKDASKNRRLLGKLGVFAAVGVILPLTATTVTVAAKDGVTVIHTGDKGDQKVKVIKMTRVKGADVDGSGNVDAPYVQTITRNGRTIVLRTNYKLSQQEIDKMADEAEASRIEADAAIGDEETARRDAEAARADAAAARADAADSRTRAEAEIADARTRREAEIEGMAAAHAMANVDSKYIASMIPEIHISEVTHNCKDGHPVTTNVSGMDGKNNSRVQIVMCGKGQAKIARAAAVEGLREALSEIRSEEDMPDSVRRQVIASLRQQIRQMQNQRD
jgi:bla regulator protein blaR1